MTVVSVHDPAGLLDERPDAGPELLEVEGRPIVLLVESVEFETRDTQGVCESRRHRRLTAARRALDHHTRQSTFHRLAIHGHRSILQIGDS